MSMMDSKNKDIQGYLRVTRLYDDGSESLIFEEKNLVVNLASTILRDIMFGDTEQISKMHFGDMNLTATDDVKNVAAPNVTDTALVHKVGEKVISKTKDVYQSKPAIKYTAVLEKGDLNGTDGSGQQLITEYALATPTDRIFTHKTRAGTYKDNETALRFDWYLAFY